MAENIPVFKPAKYTYIVADVVTNKVLASIPVIDVSFQRSLTGAGSFTGTIPINQQTSPFSLYNNTMPGRTALYVLRDNVNVWGGIIWSRDYNMIGRTLGINASEFPSYFMHRAIWKTYNYTFSAYVTKASSASKARVVFNNPNDSYVFAANDTISLQFIYGDTNYSGTYTVLSTTTNPKAPADPDNISFYVDIPGLPTATGKYTGVTVVGRIKVQDYVKRLIQEALVDFKDAKFANDIIKPGIEIPITIASANLVGGVVVATATIPPTTAPDVPTTPLAVGQKIHASNMGSAYDGTYVVSNVTPYYPAVGPISITNAVGDGTYITYTTNVVHNLQTTQKVNVAGITPTGFNQTNATIVLVPGSASQFKIASSFTGTYTSGGTVTSVAIPMTFSYTALTTNFISNATSNVYSTLGPVNFTVGQVVNITGAAPTDWNITNATITAIDNKRNTFTIANTISTSNTYSVGTLATAVTAAPDQSITLPASNQYTVNKRQMYSTTGKVAISSITRNGNIVKVTTKQPHSFIEGDMVVVKNSGNAVYNMNGLPAPVTSIDTTSPSTWFTYDLSFYTTPTGNDYTGTDTVKGIKSTDYTEAQSPTIYASVFTTTDPSLKVGDVFSVFNVDGYNPDGSKWGTVIYNGTHTVKKVNNISGTKYQVLFTPTQEQLYTEPGADSAVVSTVQYVKKTNTATITMQRQHPFNVGDTLTITGCKAPFDTPDTTTVAVTATSSDKYSFSFKPATAYKSDVAANTPMASGLVSLVIATVTPNGYIKKVPVAVTNSFGEFINNASLDTSDTINHGLTFKNSYLTANVSAITVSSGNATYTTSTAHGFSTGQYVTVSDTKTLTYSSSGTIGTVTLVGFIYTFPITGISSTAGYVSGMPIEITKSDGTRLHDHLTMTVLSVTNSTSITVTASGDVAPTSGACYIVVGTVGTYNVNKALITAVPNSTAFTITYGNNTVGTYSSGGTATVDGYSFAQWQDAYVHGSDVTMISTLLENYASTIKGFEYRIDTALDPATGRFTRDFVFVPKIPQTYVDYLNSIGGKLPTGIPAPISALGADKLVFEFPGNIDNVELNESAETSATRAFVVGNSQDIGASADSRYSGAGATDLLSAGWPLIDVSTKKDWPVLPFTQVNEDNWNNFDAETDLHKTAKKFLYQNKPPLADFNISVNGSLNPKLGTYAPGDWCSIRVNDDFVSTRLQSSLEPRKNILIRKIDLISVTVPNNPAFPEEIQLTLTAEWEVDQVG